MAGSSASVGTAATSDDHFAEIRLCHGEADRFRVVRLGHLEVGSSPGFLHSFAIAPLFVIVLAIAGFWFSEDAAHGELFSQVSGLVGSEGGEAIEALVSAAHKPKTGAWATMTAGITLFIGATGVFVQLQDALNSVCGVRREAGRGVR